MYKNVQSITSDNSSPLSVTFECRQFRVRNHLTPTKRKLYTK